MRILNSLLSFLVETGTLPSTPLSLRRRRRSRQPTNDNAQIRYIEPPEQRLVWSALHRGHAKSHRAKVVAERRRWVTLLFYGTGLRVSEAVCASMADIVRTEGRWRLWTIRKGQKRSWVPLSPEVMNGLRRYRVFLGMSPYPLPGEQVPLIVALDGESPISTRTAYDIVKRTVRRAASYAPVKQNYHASRLMLASPHWWRHTMLTDLRRRGADLQSLQRLADHSNPATTTRYLHVVDEPLYELMERHRIHKAVITAMAA